MGFVARNVPQVYPGVSARDVARRRFAAEQRRRVRALAEQRLIDAEMRETRRAVVGGLRRCGGTTAISFLDDDFLAVADPLTLHRAIVAAAIVIGGAGSADFQVYDRTARVLRMSYQQGFPRWFVAFFATVDAAQPTACGAALATQKPVFVTDVSRSPIFDRAGRDAVLAAGSRTVYSYPLLTSSRTVLGVLSFHNNKPLKHIGRATLIARGAAQALTPLARTDP